MLTVNVHKATANFSRILEAAEQGNEVLISREGEPIAMLRAYKASPKKIAAPGSMEGQIWMSDEFDEPLDEQFDVLRDDSVHRGE